MPEVLYIGAPLSLALASLLPLFLCYSALRPGDAHLKASAWLALLELALATLSVGLTTANPISRLACYTGLFGTMAMLGLAALDTLNLLWWLVRRARAEDTLPLPILFVLLRLVTHAAFTLSLWWCAQLCTV